MSARYSVAAVLFDCDGVLVDSVAAVDDAWSAWCLEYDLDPAAVLPIIHGRRAEETVRTLLPAPVVPAAVARLEDLEVEMSSNVRALPGAAAALGAVPPDRHAVATSGTRRLAVRRLEAARLPVPAVLVTADDVARGKPDPEPYLRAAAGLDVDPSRTLVFEDTPIGARAGVAAGATVIALLTSHPAGAFPQLPTAGDLSRVELRSVDGTAVSVRF